MPLVISTLRKYLGAVSNRDFFILSAITFIGQLATGFLLLSLIIAAYSRTHNNFGVSGVVLSFSIPGFLLVAVAGFITDLFDRRWVIIVSNVFITLVVFLIALTNKSIVASIPLSFLYFAGNTFFLPAASAASAQLVRKSELPFANSLFISNLGMGITVGIFLAAIINFFMGIEPTLWICEFLLVIAAVGSFFLPKLPSRHKSVSTIFRFLNIFRTFRYIASENILLMSIITFAFMQALIAFALTLTPGFFDMVVGLPVEKATIFILPFTGLGIALGTFFANRSRHNSFGVISLGIAIVGTGAFALGILILSELVEGLVLLFPVAIFLIMIGFGDMIVLVAARENLQKYISHEYQGTVFGASIILCSFISGIISPLGALIEAIYGYVNVLIFGGFGFLMAAILVAYLSRRWKF